MLSEFVLLVEDEIAWFVTLDALKEPPTSK